MNNENSAYGNYRKNIISSIYNVDNIAHLWIAVAGYSLAIRATADNCVEPHFNCLQYPTNIHEHFMYKFSLIHLFQMLPLKKYETFNPLTAKQNFSNLLFGAK